VTRLALLALDRVRDALAALHAAELRLQTESRALEAAARRADRTADAESATAYRELARTIERLAERAEELAAALSPQAGDAPAAEEPPPQRP